MWWGVVNVSCSVRWEKLIITHINMQGSVAPNFINIVKKMFPLCTGADNLKWLILSIHSATAASLASDSG